MSEEKEGTPRGWFGLVAVGCLLVVCLLLLGGQLVRAAPLEATAPEEVAVPVESPAPAEALAVLARAQAPGNGDEDSGAGVRGPASTLEIDVNYGWDWVAGTADPGATVWVTVTASSGTVKEEALVSADGGTGDFFVGCEDWFSGWCEDIVPGDRVEVWAAGLLREVSPVGSITGRVDEAAETVDGTLEADWFTENLVVACEVWEEGGPTIFTTADPDGGSFSCSFSGLWDLQRGDMVALRYHEPDGDSVINMLVWPSMRVNYGDDWVGGDYPAGHTIAITVTDSLAGEKATVRADSVVSGGWNGSEGFEVQGDDWWPTAPDLVPGDLVHFAADDGYTNTMEVGTILASVEVAADSVGGQVVAPFGAPLPVECHPWGAWDVGIGYAPVKQSWAEPDGSVPFLCQWDPATEWDVQPGQSIAVMYIEPDADRVIDVVEEPAPHVRIEKSAASAPAEGGNLRFDIELWNEGSAPADAVVVTDLMQGLEYLSDTSGLTPSGTGSGPISWMFGTLNPGIPVEFSLFADVTASVSETITNTVTITTITADNQGQPWERESSWSSHVEPSDVSLSVDKWAWTDQPAPDQDVVFSLNVCNEGSTASGEITLIDRLHPALSFEDWWSYAPGWSWVSESPGELVVALHSLDGGSCSECYVQAHVAPEAQPGDPITNTAQIVADNDPSPDDNVAFWESQVGEPYLNVWVDKGWSDGQLVPGGEIRYHISFGNDGNLLAGPLRITDTFPVSTTFASAWGNNPWGESPFPPTSVDDNQAVWEIPELGNGLSVDFVVALNVDPGALPETVLVNRAEISPLPEETQWGDNVAEWTELLFGPAPNLRVQKWHDWNGDGQLDYHLRFENIGSETVSNVWITDVLPLNTYWDGGWDLEFDWERLVTWDCIEDTRTCLWELDQLSSGESGWIHVNANLNEPGAPARWYTNRVDITIPEGDPSPGDNHAETLAFSGGEVRRVELWLNKLGPSSLWGEAVPGSPITVTTPITEVYAWADPDCGGCWDIGNAGLILPGDAVTVTAGAGLLPVHVAVPDPLVVGTDSAAVAVAGQIGGWAERPVEVHGAWEGGYQEVQTLADGTFLAVYDDVPPGASGYIRFVDQVSYAEVVYHRPFYAMDMILNVNYGHDWVEGPYEPGHTVWITVTNDLRTVKATAEMQTQGIPWWDGGTGFSTSMDEPWMPAPPDIQPGDLVYGQVDNGWTATLQIGEVSGVIDTDNDSIEGTVDAPWLGVHEVPVECHPWGGPPEAPSKQSIADPTDGDPGYLCQWDPETEWDVKNGQQIGVSYYEPVGHQVYAVFEGPWAQVNYAYDWVGINYPVGHTFVVTVTDYDTGDVKGVAEFETTPWGGWGGPGYQTGDDDWISLKPDISFGDWVHFSSDGYQHSVQVGTVALNVYAHLDRATGLLNVPWLDGVVDLLDVECHPWGGPGDAPVKYDTAPPVGTPNYLCDWDPVQEWDVLPGQDVAAMYIEPDDGDRIINVAHAPAPDLQVEKWVEGSGEVHSDGLSVWGIRIRNEGNGPAPTIVLTDILPVDTSYFRDSSGVIPDDYGDHVVWTFDAEPLPPGGQIQFLLVLRDNLPEPDAWLHNEVWAWTQFDSNPDDNNAGADAWATDVAPGMLHIGKDPSPGDPAAGSTFVYEISYGNHEAGATGPVELTDTIPAGTSILGWYSQNGYGLWQDQSTADQLILAAPTLPGSWDDTIVLRLRVDPGLDVGTQLTNTAEIDWPGGHELALRDDVWVSEPRWDAAIYKDFAGGTLVPGGLIDYSMHIKNQGNMTATVHLTDTLRPVVAHSVESWCYAGPQSFECPFTILMGGTIAMDLGEIPPGGSVDVGVRWQLDYDTRGIDREFGNCVKITTSESDSGPYNNEDCSEPQTIREWGPNLRVRKEHNWHQEGNTLHYDVYLENVGSQALDNLLITDIYPEGTTFNDRWSVQHGPWITLTHDLPGRELIFWVDGLDPGDTAQIGFDVDLTDPDLRPAWYANIVEAPLDGDVWPEDNYWQDVAVKTEIQRVELWVNPAPQPSSMWGEAAPGVPLTVTTPYSTVTTFVGDLECDTCWGFDSVGPLMPGDIVTVKAGAGLLPVEVQVPDPFVAEVDTAADQVSGQIDHLDTYLIEIYGNWDGGYQEVQTDSDGNFLAQYDDIPRGVDGYVRFVDEANYAEVVWHRPFRAMDLILEVNYGHDWVQGYYEPGHTVWITVTASDDVTVKGTAELLSQEVPEWGGFVGFSTNLGDAWDGQAPDLQPSDWVYGRVETGYASEVQIGEITGTLNLTADTIAGTVTAPWPVGTILDGWCAVWVEEGPSQDFLVDAEGGEYSCDFSGWWDLQPGHDVAVGYYEPDQDQVINVFYEPAPDLSVSKWVPGHDKVHGEGLSVWRIQIRNEGEGAAETVILTDTLSANTIYVSNSSGVEPTYLGGHQYRWDLGRMEPGETRDFVLVTWNEEADGEYVRNQVAVWAEGDNNPDNNHAEAEVVVFSGDPPSLGVDKHSEPGDPAPGQIFLYAINVGNNGPAATGPVQVTDIIPDGTSIVDWWTESDWPWEEVTGHGQLVLETVALPGYWGDTIYLQLLVDANVKPGTQLTNTVEVVSPDSSALAMNNDARVGKPRMEGFVEKRLAWGTLVPDGVVAYNIHVRNQGNMTAGFTLTDTLPVGTTFEGAWSWDGRQGGEIVPTFPEPSVVVFDLGDLKPAEFRDVEVRLHLDPDLLPGNEFGNCVEINAVGPDDWPEDNEDCAVEMVHPEGPNVRLQKDYQWNSEGQLQYNLTFWNLGTETLYEVEIVDTLPDGTHWIDRWWHNFWEGIDVRVEDNQVIFTVSRLDPEWGSNIGFAVDLDEPWNEGTAYTNSAVMPLEGDVFPDDNYDEVTAYTGPDLYVKKELDSGEPRPGALLTYTIEFGNDNVWPWNSDDLGDEGPSSMIIDLLPEGMTFLTATAPWNPEQGWMPAISGQELSWGFGPMNTGNHWKFQVVAQVSESAEFGDVLTNTVEVLSLSPDDVDPLPDNNVDRVVLEVLAPALTIEKEVSTSAVAGTSADYTLSVENVGNVPATGVSFADTLPDDLIYVDSDGAWDGADITWSAGELAPFGGTAGGWFSANLSCEAGVKVANDTYSITSNEGATAAGATVEVTTLAPTIQLSLASAPEPGFVDETVTLTVTAVTDGTDLSYEWNFGDGPVSGGLVETNVWDAAGSYTVVVTATDECAFSETVSTTVSVEQSAFYIYLPVVVRQHR